MHLSYRLQAKSLLNWNYAFIHKATNTTFQRNQSPNVMWCYFANNTRKPQYLNITDNLMVALEWSNKPSSRTAPSYRLKSNKRIIRNQGRTDLKLQAFKLLMGLHFSQSQIKIYICVYISDTASTITSFSQICQIKKCVFGNSAQLIIMFCMKDASDWIMKSTVFLKKSNSTKLVIKNIKAHMYKHYWNALIHMERCLWNVRHICISWVRL